MRALKIIKELKNGPVINVTKIEFTQEDTYFPCEGTQWIIVECIGASGTFISDDGSCKVSAGEYNMQVIPVSSIHSIQKINVGKFGANGEAGGFSSFGEFIISEGGRGDSLMPEHYSNIKFLPSCNESGNGVVIIHQFVC